MLGLVRRNRRPPVQNVEACRDLSAPRSMPFPAPSSAATIASTGPSATIDHPIVDEVRAALQAAYRPGLSCGQAELDRRVVFLEAEVERLDTAIGELQRRATVLVKVRDAASEVV